MHESNQNGECFGIYKEVMKFLKSRGFSQKQFTAFLSELDST